MQVRKQQIELDMEQQTGSTLLRALEHTDFSSCGTRALVAPQHVESSWTRDRTHVLCTGRWILIHCATRESYYTWYLKLCEWILLQGIFQTQVLNLGILRCRQIHYHLSHQGSPLLVV